MSRKVKEGKDNLKFKMLLSTLGLVLVGVIAFIICAFLLDWWTPIKNFMFSEKGLFIVIAALVLTLIVGNLIHMKNVKERSDRL